MITPKCLLNKFKKLVTFITNTAIKLFNFAMKIFESGITNTLKLFTLDYKTLNLKNNWR